MKKITTGKFVLNGTKYKGIINNSNIAPAYEIDVFDTNTVLLLHGESLEDSSIYNVPITNNGVSVSSGQSKFGGKSLYFNGSSRLLIPQNTIAFGLSNFTIDWWEYWTTTPSGVNGARFSSMYTSAANSWGGVLLGYSGSNVYMSSLVGANWDLINGASMFNVTANQWVHWACVRNGNTFITYRNGVLFSSQVLNGIIAYNDSFQMAIGDYRVGDHSYFTGYIDEFRISNVARWTSNFTPPTEPYEI